MNECHKPEDIFKTLYHLTLFAGIPHKIVLLCDGLAPGTARHLKSLSRLTALDDAGGRGRPFYFNALIAQEADLYFFLDAGVLVTEDCLTGLIEILTASPENGLAGPTMNNCWNDQGYFSDQDPLSIDPAKRADTIRGQFGQTVVDTAPLYAISETFLTVKGTVVKAVGPADIRYGRGFCWEMDYTARAVWMGFKVLWAKGLYAHIATDSVAGERTHSFARNRLYYQGKFCLRHLTKETKAYCDHCRGVDCPDFAPKALPYGNQHSSGDLPLVSCIMPTRNRPEYVQRALHYFERQDYPEREIIVLYEKPEDLPALMPDSRRIRLVKTALNCSIGEKRNRGRAVAQGEIIAQWDDDDWYGLDRLSRQTAPIIAEKADISGLYNIGFYAVDTGRYWKCAPELFDRMFVRGVQGGTLVYRKKLPGGAIRYPDTSLREDADFLVLAQSHGARLFKTDGEGIYIYIRHGRNSWQFAPGNFLDADGWRRQPYPTFPADDQLFYQNRRTRQTTIRPNNGSVAAGRQPKISCIMPTADRIELFQRALVIYLGQDYPNKELIVVDDGAGNIGQLCKEHRIVYIPLQKKTSIGGKRNIACEQACGEIIIHLDDDDWYAKSWITRQVENLSAGKAEVTGLDKLIFYDSDKREAWCYSYPTAARHWVHGATLCYLKEFWKKFTFPEIDVGEDCLFLWHRGAANILSHGAINDYIGRIHVGNASPKHTKDACWSRISDLGKLQRIERIMTGSVTDSDG